MLAPSDCLRTIFRFCILFGLVALTASCAGNGRKSPSAAAVPPPVPPIISPQPVPGQLYKETGISSWYGKDFHGRKTANGEVYDMYGISAAHRILPLGTIIRVTNLDNDKTITVRVNDRGPFVKNRILDLSYGAARELGFIAQGTTRVKIESVEELGQSALYTVQVGAFIEEANARMLKQRLSKRYDTVYIVPFESNIGKFFRVRVGSYETQEKAERVASTILLEGLEPTVMSKE